MEKRSLKTLVWLKPAAAACFLTLIVLHPASAIEAAAQSLYSWAVSVAPSLLPFLIVSPALTSEETCRVLSCLSGKFMRFLRLPQNACGAILIGLLSGSPAGAAALTGVSKTSSDPDGCFLRAALLASGASSAFLLSGIAVAMLNMPEVGLLLWRSQLAALFLTALLLRFVGSDRTSYAAPVVRSQQSTVLSAMLTLLNIGGWMVLFAVLARQLSLFISPALEVPLLATLELSGGCQALSSLSAPLDIKLPLISAASCFGGLSVYAQCLSFLLPLGVDPIQYAAGKLIQSALAACFTYLQLEHLPLDLGGALSLLRQLDPAAASALAAGVLVLLLISASALLRRRIS